MPNQTQQLSLAELILRFRDDCELTHDFAKGDSALDVIGSDGTYPSLAKLVASAEVALAATINNPVIPTVRSYRFDPVMVLKVVHPDVISTNYSYSITNTAGDKLFASDTVISDTEFWIDFTEPEGGIINVIFFPNP